MFLGRVMRAEGIEKEICGVRGGEEEENRAGQELAGWRRMHRRAAMEPSHNCKDSGTKQERIEEADSDGR